MSTDPAALARLHAACFTNPRPWRAEEFSALLADPAVFLRERPQGFVMGRCVLDEAELLTIAVHPEQRRRGIARGLLSAFDQTAWEQGARQGFLEVAADNDAALSLYLRAGWHQAGRRKSYYEAGRDAIIMTRSLSAPGA